ncbi:MAG: hypothetical protein VB115_04830 [Christensenellaceae bacterium]|nr:hypothetical protein [Christensenellaceae bacterium]
MMKDRGLKSALLSYFVHNGWYPQLEVDVKTNDGASKIDKFITDIDVLALVPSVNGVLVPLLGDCKTLRNQSPSNRVLWMRGLMEYWSAERGIIILDKSIEPDHKQFADKLGVTLLSSDDFSRYSKSMRVGIDDKQYSVSDIEIWESYFESLLKYPQISSVVKFVKFGFWNEDSAAKRLRALLYEVRTIKNELNPSNYIHLALLCDLVSLFAVSINGIVMQMFNRYTFSDNKDAFVAELKMVIWGGHDNYRFLNEIRAKYSTNESELSLPEWDRFIYLIRNCLESPRSTMYSPLLIKELAFVVLGRRTIDIQEIGNSQLYVGTTDPYAIKSSALYVEYFCKACKLPPEFLDCIVSSLLRIGR